MPVKSARIMAGAHVDSNDDYRRKMMPAFRFLRYCDRPERSDGLQQLQDTPDAETGTKLINRRRGREANARRKENAKFYTGWNVERCDRP